VKRLGELERQTVLTRSDVCRTCSLNREDTGLANVGEADDADEKLAT
jgi:hypothetical protein